MKAIHIASHKGNIGDIINHKGFYDIFKTYFNADCVDKIELRDFYYSANNRKRFDVGFADVINTYDLCIWGGGGFFDAQWERSATGTTLDLSKEFINGIKIPVLVNAMGYHEYPGETTQIICNKFNDFISLVSSKENWLVTVRNDGSIERLKNRYGDEFIARIIKVLDNGFFCPFPEYRLSKKSGNTVGICLSNDLFSNIYNRDITTTMFNRIMSKFIEKLLVQGMKIILLPHVPGDINVICEVLSAIPESFKRSSIVVAPYDASTESAVEQIGLYYSACDCIIGMRFHSLIIGMNLNIPTVALAGHAQIEALFSDLRLGKYCVRVDNEDFAQRMNCIIYKCINDSNEFKEMYDSVNKYLCEQRDEYKVAVKGFLKLSNDK